ncbi:histidine--tRNA ligase [Mycoplasma enhydrae]|uniref:histidine--tRNA ligase n=1 Tax=Mycoplasma enhydrae TaxID=2499220 RepID=UPI00197C6416|nr:histidine--tRNA ligase [Mycoplasma enhydrae]MBN4089499.1 histidine--tRNA ligase [Mycoplasma enhydrae]MCV3733656.1 histidine--tRNA ligase [Mycoplasma enhydrae]MCV3753363.1 histidine--tRNA ligase [Mycoplasma enhydrae]
MFSRLKGTKDIYNNEAKIIDFIHKSFEKVSWRYNYKHLETPIIEDYNLFVRATGETSDIVTKEMYVFKDNGNRTIALRPEGTAAVIRAYIENKINNLENAKLYYFGPMFRYERPQKGRYRQFIQGGIELIEPKSVLSNFEIIKLAYDFLQEIKVEDFVLEINNLGNFETRNNYVNSLKKYFLEYKSQLSETSQIRLEKNVLRILDDKDEIEKDFVKNAPKLVDFLSQKEKDDYKQLLQLLDKNQIKYVENPYLVRGLDYYTDIVFEFVSTSKALGSKSTILGGGRYDGMIKSFGGPDIGSIGFAFGVDRLVEIINYNLDKYDNLKDNLEILAGYLNEDEKDEIIKIVYDLRKEFSVEFQNFKINIKQLFKLNFKHNPKILLFKELNSKPNYIKLKSKNKELEFEYTGLESFKQKIKEVL